MEATVTLKLTLGELDILRDAAATAEKKLLVDRDYDHERKDPDIDRRIMQIRKLGEKLRG